MLDVIGAGATATTDIDWYEPVLWSQDCIHCRVFNRHAVWNSTPEAEVVQKEIDEIHVRGRNQPAIQATLHGEFATSWFNQLWQLMYRGSRAHWRNPTYLMAKLVLNTFAGLFIGVRLPLII